MSDDLEEKRREDAHRTHDELRALIKSSSAQTIDFAHNAIRAFFLLNGGAAVALLATLAQLHGDEAARQLIPGIVGSLRSFAWGVGAAAATAASSYLAQLCYTIGLNTNSVSYSHPYVTSSGSTAWWQWAGYFFQLMGIVMGFAALAAFFIGAEALRAAFLG